MVALIHPVTTTRTRTRGQRPRNVRHVARAGVHGQRALPQVVEDGAARVETAKDEERGADDG